VIVNSNVAHDETVNPISASGIPRATGSSIPGSRSVNAATRARAIMHQPRNQYSLAGSGLWTEAAHGPCAGQA